MSPTTHPQRISLTLEGKTYEVEIADPNTWPIEVTVDGQRYTVEVQASRIEAIPAPGGAALPMGVQPSPTSTPATAAPAYSAHEIRSPMPGNILDIAVAPGDRVVIGQTLCALEAMKMKSAIRSPREGVIAAVHVSDGQVVAHAELLFTFE
jgi:biotin carboxyl carrier protein